MYGLLVISYDPRAGWIWPYSEHLLTITACMVVISIKFNIHGPWGGGWGVPFGGCLSSDRIGRHKGKGHVLHNSLESLTLPSDVLFVNNVTFFLENFKVSCHLIDGLYYILFISC